MYAEDPIDGLSVVSALYTSIRRSQYSPAVQPNGLAPHSTQRAAKARRQEFSLIPKFRSHTLFILSVRKRTDKDSNVFRIFKDYTSSHTGISTSPLYTATILWRPRATGILYSFSVPHHCYLSQGLSPAPYPRRRLWDLFLSTWHTSSTI